MRNAPAVAAAPAGSDVPGWLLPLLLAGMALAALVFALGTQLGGGGGEGFTRPMRASFADAGSRTSDAFAYARDVLRYGR